MCSTHKAVVTVNIDSNMESLVTAICVTVTATCVIVTCRV